MDWIFFFIGLVMGVFIPDLTIFGYLVWKLVDINGIHSQELSFIIRLLISILVVRGLKGIIDDD